MQTIMTLWIYSSLAFSFSFPVTWKTENVCTEHKETCLHGYNDCKDSFERKKAVSMEGKVKGTVLRDHDGTCVVKGYVDGKVKYFKTLSSTNSHKKLYPEDQVETFYSVTKCNDLVSQLKRQSVSQVEVIQGFQFKYTRCMEKGRFVLNLDKTSWAASGMDESEKPAPNNGAL